MSAKLFPFWWLVPPISFCYLNSCEDLGDWTIDDAFTASIDSVTFQEGAGSLQINLAGYAPGDIFGKLLELNNNRCAEWLGFWVKADLRDVGTDTVFFAVGRRLGLYDTSFRDHVIQFRRTDEGVFELRHVVDGIGAGYLVVGDWIPFSNGEWFWIELRDRLVEGVGTYEARVNGVDLETLEQGTALIEWDMFYFWVPPGYYLGTVRIDGVRLHSELEYPPVFE